MYISEHLWLIVNITEILRSMYEGLTTLRDSECIYWENQPFTKQNNSEYQCNGLSANYRVPVILHSEITQRSLREYSQISLRLLGIYSVLIYKQKLPIHVGYLSDLQSFSFQHLPTQTFHSSKSSHTNLPKIDQI